MNAKQEIADFDRFVSGLVVGQRCNVRRRTDDVPMVREITFAGREKRRDGEWIAWRWKSEGKTPEGHMDCGYSGYHITRALNYEAARVVGAAANVAAAVMAMPL